jgi:serine kinase of HPr protein (carbohydrate metabolism regulator)
VDPIADLEGSDEINVIPFILGPVMALLLHQRGFLVLHGSSVRVKERAVAFLGYRGKGKSTTAIHLYQDGYPLVTDDILAIKFREEGLPVVYPGYPHVRLNEDSYNQVKTKTDILTPIRTIAGKVFCDASYGFSSEPVDLERIYVIEKDDMMRISNLKSQDNLLDLIRHSVANRIFQYDTQKENLIHCAQLVNNVSVKQLEIFHSFNDVPKLIRIIEKDLEN